MKLNKPNWYIHAVHASEVCLELWIHLQFTQHECATMCDVLEESQRKVWQRRYNTTTRHILRPSTN